MLVHIKTSISLINSTVIEKKLWYKKLILLYLTSNIFELIQK